VRAARRYAGAQGIQLEGLVVLDVTERPGHLDVLFGQPGWLGRGVLVSVGAVTGEPTGHQYQR
jgi:hypothetical protein